MHLECGAWSGDLKAVSAKVRQNCLTALVIVQVTYCVSSGVNQLACAGSHSEPSDSLESSSP